MLQGCLWSGALCNVGIDPLLWCFSHTIVQPGLGKVFACADDVGAALCSLRALIPCAKLFNMFRKISGLVLKPSKCVIILTSVSCSERNILAVRNWLEINIPEWKDMNITNHGKYLGFFIGPDAGKHNESTPSPSTSREPERFMLLHCLRLFRQMGITPSVSPPSSMFRSFAPPRPTSFRLSLVLYIRFCIFRRRPLATI